MLNENSTIKELMEAGIGVSLTMYSYGNTGLQDAYNKIKPFKDLGKVVFVKSNGYTWLRVTHGNFSISAFYEQKGEK